MDNVKLTFSEDVLSIAREYFSESYYLQRYTDVAESEIDPFDHFILNGWRERRDPTPTFSVRGFLHAHPELEEMGFAAFIEWVKEQELRKDSKSEKNYFLNSYAGKASELLSTYFDTSFYLDTYPDVMKSGMHPLQHFMGFGWIERRDPAATFSTAAYLDARPDLRLAGGNPFVDFLLRREFEEGAPQAFVAATSFQTGDSPQDAVKGEVKRISPNGILGWAWDPNRPEERLTVEAVVGNEVIATAKAELFDAALVESGVGDGVHAFEIRFDPPLALDGALPQVRMSGAGGRTLPGPSVWSAPIVEWRRRSAPSASTAQVFIDWFNARGVWGWAWHPDIPDAAVFIEAVRDGKVIASAVATEFRVDLRDAGKGTGYYGFRLTFDASEQDHRPIRLRVPGGAEFPLVMPSSGAVGGAKSSSGASFEGSVDYLNRRQAIGWVWCPSNPDATLAVEAILDGEVIGRGVADVMREDLLKWGKGTGRCGFKITFDKMVLGDVSPTFRVIPAIDEVLGSTPLPALTAAERALQPSPGIEHFFAEHARFTAPSPDFEESDPSILGQLDASAVPAKPLVFAYYLPQFHTIPENDHFWGKGFTEWRQLGRAVPRFPGHYQPRIPRDLGFYDLTHSEVLARQAEMAKAAGVGAFCYYYYWFNARRVLERPLEAHLNSSVDMPFMIMWANENWTRTWDGSESSILLRQDYLDENEDALLADIARHFADPRYVRLNGRPLFFLYNPKHVPEAAATLARWREKFRANHAVDPLIFMAQTFAELDPTPYGLDGAIEFPPHKLSQTLPGRATPDAYSQDFKGRVIAYEDFATVSLSEEAPDYPLIKTIVPSWDNDSRRPGRGLTLEGASPAKYQEWLEQLIERAIDNPIEGVPLVAVNAWNEWAEAAYLEPDVHYGAAYLNATARALVGAVNKYKSPNAREDALRVTVILPCYNHARFLPERIGSILQQTVKPDEIIFLDDASTDDSVAVARALLRGCPIPWRIEANEENSGNVFRQWLKGISLAANDLIWIAETDDLVDRHFLANILPAFRKGDVLGAYGHIRCIDPEGELRNDLDGYYDGLKFHSWGRSSTVAARLAFSHDFSVRNIVPNASGFVFRKPSLREDEIERLLQYRFAGDWYFYALVLRGGSLAYRRGAKSYFRVNPKSVSRSAFFTERHLEEHRMVLADIAREYGLTGEALQEHAVRLAELFPDRKPEELVEILSPREVERRLRICIASHSFDVGGGEVVPVDLANKLKSEGNHVTYLVMESPKTDLPSIQKRLRADIPIVHWKDVSKNFPEFLEDHGIEVFNSHNVSVEYKLYCHHLKVPCLYIASLHGGYETVPNILTPDFIQYVRNQVDVWMTLADKNIEVLRKAGLEGANFCESFNAVSDTPVNWADRATIRRAWGIPSDAFVLALCSRAIEDKGWRTAIETCRLLNQRETARPTYLVLIGDGPLLPELKAALGDEPRVHFSGHLDSPMRYFRAFDLAIFPSTYVGETFPMFLMESLAAGLPVVATDIGEIPRIMGPSEVCPGALVSRQLPREQMAEEMAEIILSYMRDEETYRKLRDLTAGVSSKFSMTKLVDLYMRVARTHAPVVKRD